ncbi:MAG: sulfite exporter TauE/SafE family protein [Hyphomicrobiaceae bacterium]
MDSSGLELAIPFFVALAAGLMRGFAGVGSGMLMAPFFVYSFGPVSTVGIIILIEIAATAQLLPSVHRSIEWRTILPMGLAACVAMPLGSWLLISLDTESLQFGVALLVTVCALLLMTGWRYEGSKPLVATIGVGSLSGLLMALTSLGNPPVMLYLMSSKDPAMVNRANFTGYFALTLLALITLMSAGGLIGYQEILRAGLLLPGFLLATWIGSRLFQRSNEQMYRRVAFAILLAAGIYGMLR